PLGMSGARLVTTAAYQLRRTGGRYALCTMCKKRELYGIPGDQYCHH
ncbi:MAG: hypothetical protein HRU12_06145, partial [Phaeodactylibacter sp.]|nr:hypothetical protein [Phaeodactylibacter sp.]